MSEGPEQGIVIELEDGPEIIFGDADCADEKWTAAVRVLADVDAAGATYIDVRLPERPVAGGLPVETIEPVAPAGDVIAPPVEPSRLPTPRCRPIRRPRPTAPRPRPTTRAGHHASRPAVLNHDSRVGLVSTYGREFSLAREHAAR